MKISIILSLLLSLFIASAFAAPAVDKTAVSVDNINDNNEINHILGDAVHDLEKNTASVHEDEEKDLAEEDDEFDTERLDDLERSDVDEAAEDGDEMADEALEEDVKSFTKHKICKKKVCDKVKKCKYVACKCKIIRYICKYKTKHGKKFPIYCKKKVCKKCKKCYFDLKCYFKKFRC